MKELHQNEKLKQPGTDAKTQEISHEYKKKKAHNVMEKLSPTNEAVGLRNNLSVFECATKVFQSHFFTK